MDSTIKIMDVVKGTSSNTQGYTLYLAIHNQILTGSKIRLSLNGLTALSSSFLHSSFGNLIDKFGYDKIKTSIVLVDFKLSDANKIKKYIEEIAALNHSD